MADCIMGWSHDILANLSRFLHLGDSRVIIEKFRIFSYEKASQDGPISHSYNVTHYDVTCFHVLYYKPLSVSFLFFSQSMNTNFSKNFFMFRLIHMKHKPFLCVISLTVQFISAFNDNYQSNNPVSSKILDVIQFTNI